MTIYMSISRVWVAMLLACTMVVLGACGDSPDNRPDKKSAALKNRFIPTAQETRDQVPEFEKPRRRALLIGIGNYSDPTLDLDNAENDARLMSRSLSKIGFNTSTLLNADGDDALDRLLDFLADTRPSDFNLIYYAGHAFQINGENYLAPADFEVLPLASGDISGMIRLSQLVQTIQQSGAKNTIIILDACRNNPLEAIDVGKGLAQPPPIPQDSTAEILFLYAAAPGRVAKDRIREEDRNSPFTRSLAGWITDKNLTFDRVVQATIRDVSADTLGLQVPWVSSNFATPVRLAATEEPEPILFSGVPTELAGQGNLLVQPDIWNMIDQNARDSLKGRVLERRRRPSIRCSGRYRGPRQCADLSGRRATL